MDIQPLLGAVPVTTIVVAGILFVFRNDLWQQLLDSNAEYYNINRYQVLLYGGISIILVMAVFGFFYWLYQNYIQQLKIRNKAQMVADLERQALVAIFESLGGLKWKDKTRWCSSEPIGRWKGVHLDPKTKRVNKIILAENELEGEIPEEIGNLTELIELDLRSNRIKGK